MELRVRVRPGARRERVTTTGEGEFDIAVREEAQRNEANKRVKEILSLTFQVPIGRVHLRSGARGSRKRFVISI